MQFQTFAPGTDSLDAAATNKLAKLAEALRARPELEVEIEGNVDPALDGDALRRAKLELHLRTVRWNSLRAAARANLTPEQITLAPEERADLLTKAFRDAVKTNAALATTPTVSTETSTNRPTTVAARPRTETEKGAAQLLQRNASRGGVTASANPGGTAPVRAGEFTEVQMAEILSRTFTVADTEFAALARRRAEAVHANLVTTLNIAAERVLTAESTAASYPTNGARVNLQLR